MISTLQVLKNCEKNLERNRAVATGIDVFARIREGPSILMRNRTEKSSLFSQNLSGKWELPGGGVELFDFEKDYQSAIILALERELMEEAGLQLIPEKIDVRLIPAWLGKDGIIDLAFTIDIPEAAVKKTKQHRELLKKGGIKWITYQNLRKLEYVSERMRFLTLNSFI